MGFSGDIREAHSKARRVLEEAVANIHNVFSFNADGKVLQLFKQQMRVPLWRSFVRGQTSGFIFGVSQFFLFASNAIILWYSTRLLRVHPQFNEVAFPHPLRGYIVYSFVTFVMIEAFGLAPLILKRRQSIVPVFAIIDRRPKVESDDHVGSKPIIVAGRLEFQDVEYMYPTKPEIVILHNFNLKVEAGQTLAIVGTAGSGKTTILSLVERFYEPVFGRILLDGKDLKLLNVRWLRSHMGLVQQEPVLFSTTIRENIMYARPNATETEMTEAARIANAHHFICSLPHGYDTHIGMRGLQLSAGQRLRIAIARVVLKNPPILLIDEASAAVEADSNRVVQDALDQLIMGSRTTIVVAHRLALMRRVDVVALLHDGQIVEEGSHDNLMTKLGLYARLMQPQFNRNLSQHRNTQSH
jgi:ATP-binding cassette subfamily B (MDR/TAP) protein 1